MSPVLLAAPVTASSFAPLFWAALLWAGFVLYGMSTAILVLALRNQELSILYPVISLTYVWVAILSLIVFGVSPVRRARSRCDHS